MNTIGVQLHLNFDRISHQIYGLKVKLWALLSDYISDLRSNIHLRKDLTCQFPTGRQKFRSALTVAGSVKSA